MPMPAQRPGKSRQDYETPIEFLHALQTRLSISSFIFDFAADSRNRKAVKFWTEQDDSLSKSAEQWSRMVGGKILGGWGWLNPPFAKIRPWAERCLTVSTVNGGRIALLVPASVGASWYRDCIDQCYGVEVLFLNPRLSFDGLAPFPKDCMCVLFHGDDRAFSARVWTWK